MNPVLELPIDRIEHPKVARIVAELRAQELRKALSKALAGAPHWRQEARILLRNITDGRLP